LLFLPSKLYQATFIQGYSAPTFVDLMLQLILRNDSPRPIYCRMDRWLCPIGRRKCRYSCNLQKVLILLFSVLLIWPNLL